MEIGSGVITMADIPTKNIIKNQYQTLMNDFLIQKIKQFSWKDIYNEHYGLEDPVPENPTSCFNGFKKNKKTKVQGCYVGDKFFKTANEAAESLGVPKETFRDWLNGRRNPKMKEQLKLKKP